MTWIKLFVVPMVIITDRFHCSDVALVVDALAINKPHLPENKAGVAVSCTGSPTVHVDGRCMKVVVDQALVLELVRS